MRVSPSETETGTEEASSTAFKRGSQTGQQSRQNNNLMIFAHHNGYFSVAEVRCNGEPGSIMTHERLILVTGFCSNINHVYLMLQVHVT